MKGKKLINIAISMENYKKLKLYGETGESFNDALTKVFQLLESKK
jgi:predicted CopG family antitoxin